MENLKQIIAGQIQSILTVYNRFPDKMNEVEKEDLKNLAECLQILQKDKR